VDDFLCESMNLCGTGGRNLIALLIIGLLTVGVFMKTRNTMIALGVAKVTAIACWILGLMSLLPLVMIVILGVAMMVRDITKGGG